GRADRDGARHVGGAVEILRPGIEEVERARRQSPLGLRARAVMNDSAVGPGARDRREAEVAEKLALAAQRLEPVGGGDLAQRSARRLLREPGEEARHRRAVATMRGARSCELDF